MYSPFPEDPLRKPTPLSRGYPNPEFPMLGDRIDCVVGDRIIDSRDGAPSRDGLVSGEAGIELLYASGDGGGMDATRLPERGGCGNADAIDEARFGCITDESREGVALSRCGREGVGMPPDDVLWVGEGSCEARRKADLTERELDGMAGRAPVGGCEELKLRGVRGIVEVVAIAVGVVGTSGSSFGGYGGATRKTEGLGSACCRPERWVD